MKINYLNLIQVIIILATGFCLFMLGYTMPHKAIPITDRERVDVVERESSRVTIYHCYPNGLKTSVTMPRDWVKGTEIEFHMHEQ